MLTDNGGDGALVRTAGNDTGQMEALATLRRWQ
jgi:hypothetical protein